MIERDSISIIRRRIVLPLAVRFTAGVISTKLGVCLTVSGEHEHESISDVLLKLPSQPSRHSELKIESDSDVMR